jgi:hypothetical protein
MRCVNLRIRLRLYGGVITGRIAGSPESGLRYSATPALSERRLYLVRGVAFCHHCGLAAIEPCPDCQTPRLCAAAMTFRRRPRSWERRPIPSTGPGAADRSARRIEDSSIVQRFFRVRRAKTRSSSGCESRPAVVAPAGSNGSSRGGNEAAEAFGVEGRRGRLGKLTGHNDENAEQDPKQLMQRPTQPQIWGRLPRSGKRAKHAPDCSVGAWAMACQEEEDRSKTGSPITWSQDQLEAREGQTGHGRVAERLVMCAEQRVVQEG